MEEEQRPDWLRLISYHPSGKVLMRALREIATDAAAKAFDSLYNDNNAEAAAAWQRVCAESRVLALSYPKFEDLPAEALDNVVYDRQLGKLNESDIPDYLDKAERERNTCERLFRTPGT